MPKRNAQSAGLTGHDVISRSKRMKELDKNEDEEYEVEDLKAKRWNEQLKEPEYLVKWMYWPESCNTWEKRSNLACDELVADFEAKYELPTQLCNRKPVRAKTGFEEGLWPLSISGVCQQEGDPSILFYKVNWEGNREPEWISSKDLSERSPALLLRYLTGLIEIEHTDDECIHKDILINNIRQDIQEMDDENGWSFKEGCDTCSLKSEHSGGETSFAQSQASWMSALD